jgi:hypothetical protein
MTFHKDVVKTAVTADDISESILEAGIYGYFADDAESLRKAVTLSRTSARCLYGRLTKILSAENRARFMLGRGDFMFSLFYPTDSYLNTERY